MPNIGAPELIIILVIALLILGPGKLPEVGASIGKSIREFRKASADVQESVKVDVSTAPLPNTLSSPAVPNVTATPTEPEPPVASGTSTPDSTRAS
jgi:sec-independent protein translocase protein TatA